MTVVHNPTAYDIPIATLTMPELTSSMMIQVSDFSTMHRLNIDTLQKPQFIYNPAASGFGELSHTNIMLTDAFAYDPVLKRSTPLWYHHSISGVIKTDTYIDRTILTTWSKTEDTLLQIPESLTTSTLLVDGSVTVTSTDGTSYGDEYKTGIADTPLVIVDYAKGILRLRGSADAVAGPVVITYRLVTLNLAFTVPSPYLYRLTAKCRMNQPQYYHVAILTDYAYPLRVAYDRCDVDTIDRHTEYTQVCERWHNVPSTVTGNADRTFYIQQKAADTVYEIVITGMFRPYLTYAMLSRGTTSAIRRIRIAPNRTYDECWSLQEKCTAYRASTKCKGFIIDATHIKVPNTGLYITRGSDGLVSNVLVTRANGERVDVADSDAAAGIIVTAEPVSKKETIYVLYDYITEYRDLPYLCMNPTHRHDHAGLYDTGNLPWAVVREDLATKVCIISMYQSDTGMRYGVTITSRLQNSTIAQYTLETLTELFNPKGTQTPFSVYTYDNGAFTKKTTTNTVYPLAVLYLSSPIDASAITIEDARVYGGGTATQFSNQYDTAYYDGEITDMSAYLDINISAAVYNDLVARILQHHPDILYAENKEEQAHIIARNLIAAGVDKATLAGSIKEIRIG